MKVYKTRLDKRNANLKMKGLLPIDRQILMQVGRKLTPAGAVDAAASYCLQVAAMTAVDAQIMKTRTACRATTAVGKSVAVRISCAETK